MDILYYVIVGAVALGLGFFIGFHNRKKIAEAKIGSAEKEAKRILEDALREAETKSKDLLISARENAVKIQTEAEEEIKERRKDITFQEKRIAQKEETIEKKLEQLERREAELQKKHQELDAAKEQVAALVAKQEGELERIAGMTAEQAVQQLLARKKEELEHETAKRIASFEEQYKEEVEDRAKDLLSLAIQRCAADHVAETAISTVPLASDDMKGRIIGREGRNIRTIETLTGVELIIDDTPEIITVSAFDPIRREIARLSLEKLLSDGRIHPGRIEETVEKCRKEVENGMKQAGENAVFEVGIHGINPELVKVLGHLKYRTSYGQNVLRHSIEVALLSGALAEEMGLDSTLAKRAGLLHDIGKALTAEMEGTHVQLGCDLARKYHESKDVIHAIEAHHGDVEAKTPIALIVQAADAISAARPGARRENMESYIKRLQRLEEIAKEFPGVDSSFAIQAGREIRVMVHPDEVTDDQMVIMAHDIAKKIEADLEYPGQIKVNIIREKRVTDLAK